MPWQSMSYYSMVKREEYYARTCTEILKARVEVRLIQIGSIRQKQPKKWFCLKTRFQEYLRENEFFRKTILAYLSGEQMGSMPITDRDWVVQQIIGCVKSHDTVSLKNR